MGLYINCKQATEMISKREEKRLGLINYLGLQYHLAICSLCKLFAKQNQTIIKSMALVENQSAATLTESEKQQIVEVLETAS
jgi:hypothetical protein